MSTTFEGEFGTLNKKDEVWSHLIYVSHHDVRGVAAVDADPLHYELGGGGREVLHLWQRRPVRFPVAAADVGLHDGHAVRRQCPGLVAANGRGVAHRLAGVQVPHQVVVGHHFLLREFGCHSRASLNGMG